MNANEVKAIKDQLAVLRTQLKTERNSFNGLARGQDAEYQRIIGRLEGNVGALEWVIRQLKGEVQ